VDKQRFNEDLEFTRAEAKGRSFEKAGSAAVFAEQV
jgi:hypothetical protein